MKRVLFLLSLLCSLSVQGQHTMTVDLARPMSTIRPEMYGIFFEDINFGADGGLYAELVKNRSFEFPQSLVGWVPFGNVRVQDSDPCFARNPHYLRVVNDGSRSRAGIDNEGFRGIGLEKGAKYRFSAYVRTPATMPMTLSVELVNSNSENLLRQQIEVRGAAWQKITAVLESPFTDAHARLRIVLTSPGEVDMDHISLFPVDTWKGRENGLRKDLAQALHDLNPGVLRFPGGCIIEGNTLDTRYQWKNSVGVVENRPLNENRWNYTFQHKAAPDYYQTYGLGFYEFFLLSEDIGAEPLPVVNCGLACQFESKEAVALDQMGPYVQDALDLIEFANGPVTTTWGKVRAEMGHPEPFHLKMIAVGNEQWGDCYPERLTLFVEAIRAKYPEIKVIGSSGPGADGEQFDALWREMKRVGVDLVDEHYYMSPDWFFANAARYDKYDRTGPKVFAGEYASHDYANGKANNLLSALSEAAFMTGLERNADVVQLATYAPLFAHVDAWQWHPDMIWFDNLRLMRTPNYYVQQLYGLHVGTQVLPVLLDGKPVSGQEQLYASAALDAPTGEVILKLVNASAAPRKVRIDFEGLKKRRIVSGVCIYLQNDDPLVVNTLDAESVVPRMRPVEVSAQQITLSLDPYFFGVYRLQVK